MADAPKFMEVYLLRDVTGMFTTATLVVAGVRQARRRTAAGEMADAVEFLSPEPHQIFGVPQEVFPDVFRVADKTERGGGPAPLWEFVPLSLAAWRRLGEHGNIVGYAKLREQVWSHDVLRNFYLSEWLYDAWVENPEPDPG